MPSGTPERVSVRDGTYSRWRRARCGRDQYCTDVDFLEWRGRPNGTRRLAALIEAKVEDAPFPDWQRDVICQLAAAAGIPAFLVRHPARWIPDTGAPFRVWALNWDAAKALDVEQAGCGKTMTMKGYRNMLRSL